MGKMRNAHKILARKLQRKIAGFEVFVAVKVEFVVSWVVAPCCVMVVCQ
jgi:hypothetical protein